MFKRCLFLCLAAGLLAACNSNTPMTGKYESLSLSHIYYGNGNLESKTRISQIQAVQDRDGLLHITVPIRSTTDEDQYVDAFATYFRSGQFVEKVGPKTFVLKGNLPDTMQFTSTQPADDYSISLDYAK